MKKLVSLTMVLLMAIIICCGCGKVEKNEFKEEKEAENYEEIYMKVLKDEKKCMLMEAYQDENEMLLSEIKNEYSMKDKDVSYAILDFDRDKSRKA